MSGAAHLRQMAFLEAKEIIPDPRRAGRASRGRAVAALVSWGQCTMILIPTQWGGPYRPPYLHESRPKWEWPATTSAPPQDLPHKLGLPQCGQSHGPRGWPA